MTSPRPRLTSRSHERAAVLRWDPTVDELVALGIVPEKVAREQREKMQNGAPHAS